MKRPTKNRPLRKPAVHKPASQVGANAVRLADRIASAPRLSDKKGAHARVTAWLSELSSKDAKPIEILLSERPIIRTLLEGLAESSPYLWDLASREPERLLRLLQADPDNHLRTLLDQSARAVSACNDESEAMRLLRRMKSEAALLIALADIGGIWPVMHAARALTDLADTAVDAAVRFCLAEAARTRPAKLPSGDATRIDVATAMAVASALDGRHADAAQLCGNALVGAASGSAGWMLPVEPLLYATLHHDAWSHALAILRHRAA